MPVDPKTIARIGMRDRARILAYIRVIVRDAHIAEDVLQEVHALAIEKADQIESEARLGQWLRGAARRVALRTLRDRAQAPSPLDAAALDSLDTQWDYLDASADQSADALKALDHCLGELSDNARRIIDWRYREKLTGKQIAEKLDRTPDSLYVTMSRIHAQLGKCVRAKLNNED